MARFIALIDSSALYSIRVTNLTLELAKARLFQPRWSAQIHAEWKRNVIAKNPTAPPDQVAFRQQRMDDAFPDALVDGFEPLMVGLSLPHANDVHVLAAAIHARADVIVTFNTRHFPNEALDAFCLEAQHPDTFLLHQMTLAPAQFVAAAQAVRGRLSRPPHTVADYLASLRTDC